MMELANSNTEQAAAIHTAFFGSSKVGTAFDWVCSTACQNWGRCLGPAVCGRTMAVGTCCLATRAGQPTQACCMYQAGAQACKRSLYVILTSMAMCAWWMGCALYWAMPCCAVL
jgi:hypothetical protein